MPEFGEMTARKHDPGKFIANYSQKPDIFITRIALIWKENIPIMRNATMEILTAERVVRKKI
jgi:hypothetical protein